jgi:hypothetical protein
MNEHGPEQVLVAIGDGRYQVLPADAPSAFEAMLPPHAAELSLTHNEHRNDYETMERWVATAESYHHFDWVSPEERARAIETDSCWVLHWCPLTPVGFNAIAASTLTALMAHFRT